MKHSCIGNLKVFIAYEEMVSLNLNRKKPLLET